MHIESTVEQSEERMSALVENGVAGSGGTFEAGSVAEVRLRELGNKMARLMEMVTGLQGGQEVVGAAPGLNETTDATTDEAVPDAPSVPLSVQTVRGRRSSSAADVAVPLRPVHAMGIVDSAGVSEEDTSAGNGDGGVEAGEADRQEEASASAQDKVKIEKRISKVNFFIAFLPAILVVVSSQLTSVKS